MIQIAFCDDDQTVLDQLSALLEKYRAQRCVQIQCTAFHSPLDLLAEIEKGTRYDILFLDVIMPAENGITAAKEIRQYDNVVKIIFLTSSAEFAVESYVVGAYFYQLKPIWEDSFFRLTDSVIAECRRGGGEHFLGLDGGIGEEGIFGAGGEIGEVGHKISSFM